MVCMDLNDLRKRFSPAKILDRDAIDGARPLQARSLVSFKLIAANVTRTFAALLVILPILVTLTFVYRSPHSDRPSSFAEARVLDPKPPFLITSESLGKQFTPFISFLFKLIVVCYVFLPDH